MPAPVPSPSVWRERSSPSPVRREDIEDRTDRAVSPALAVLGDDTDDVLLALEPWGQAIRDAGGYRTPLVRFTSDISP